MRAKKPRRAEPSEDKTAVRFPRVGIYSLLSKWMIGPEPTKSSVLICDAFDNPKTPRAHLVLHNLPLGGGASSAETLVTEDPPQNTDEESRL